MIDKVKIGAFDYEIKVLPEIWDVEGEYYGMAEYGLLQIKLSEKEAKEIRVQTLLHEVIHVIMHQAGFREHNEAVIEAMSYGLIAVLRENPAFVDDLLDK